MSIQELFNKAGISMLPKTAQFIDSCGSFSARTEVFHQALREIAEEKTSLPLMTPRQLKAFDSKLEKFLVKKQLKKGIN